MAFDLLSFLLGKSTGSGGGGGSAALGPKTIRKNGVYRASSDNLDGYNAVTVEVPNTYAAADEGKVVSNGALVAQTSRTITENGSFDTTLNDEVVVNVPSGDNVQQISGTITGDDTTSVKINCDFMPDFVYMKRINLTALSTRVYAGCMCFSDGVNQGFVKFQNNGGTTAFTSYQAGVTDKGFSWSNGVLTVPTGLSDRTFSSECQYYYYAAKWIR